MGKYSSDSDSEKRGSKSSSSYKSRNKHRSSSSSSSDSRSRRRKRRSRSRDKYSKSRRSRSSSAHKSKSRRSRYRRSHSRDHYHRSRSRSRVKHRRSRSRSRSYIREYSSSKPRRHSSSSSSSSDAKHESNVEENVRSSEGRRSPEVSKVDIKALNAINEDGFAPKQFTSSSSKSKKMMDNIVIDLKKQTIKVPEVEPVEPDSIFHHNLFLNEEARMEKWIKELYGYRQKALQQGLKSSEKL